MLNQVQHKVQYDIKKEPEFQRYQIMSKNTIKSTDIFDDLLVLTRK